jgi:transcriptional/translational regulatory protein YebC/TACO1
MEAALGPLLRSHYLLSPTSGCKYMSTQVWLENFEITMRASVEVELDIETGRKVLSFLDVLEDLDDTQAVYSNADFPDEAYD